MNTASRALAFASRWFDATTVDRVFAPLIADWHRELSDASAAQRPLLRVRWAVSFVVAIIACSPAIWRISAPAALTNRIATRMVRFTLIGAALATLPAVFSVDLGRQWYLIAFVLPPAMALIFPFAMVGAADEIRTQDHLAPHAARALAARIALLGVALMVVFDGFVVPAANQAWRVTTSANRESAPVPGVRELSTFALLAEPMRVPEYEAFTGRRDRAARIRGELQRRAAMALLPMTLIWLRWVALAAPRRGWFRPLPATGAVAVAFTVFLISFFAGWRIEFALAPHSGAGVWLPLVALTFLEGLFGELRKRTAA